MSEPSSRPGPRGKVGRLLDEHDLDGVGDFLVDRWTTENEEESMSLRKLAREFNIRLLEARLTQVNADPIGGTAQSYYESLTGADVSSGERTQARRRLEQSGVDPDELMDDFVSRQAIHTYLTKTRGVTKPETDSSASSAAVRETIDRLRERVRQVTASQLTRLREAGKLSIGEMRIIVDVQVYCGDCGTQQSVSELLAAGTCDCE